VARNGADDFDKPATFSRPARFVIGVAVFIFGVFVGAALAAWVVPPL
jgi:hypothetical protein